MPFPKAPRVIYKKNPLDKVICQIKFPPILKIDGEIPDLFQDKIRSVFPKYSEAINKQIDIPQELIRKIPLEIIGGFPRILDKKNHEFTSEDDIWTINLTGTFIAFSCSKYTRWEDFFQKFKMPFKKFLDIYSPSYIARIGLRYLDVIRLSVLNLTNSKWSELLKPHILGLLSSPDVENRIDVFENRQEILLSDNASKVRIITSFVEHIEEHEKCFMIDSDFFNETRMGIEEVWDKLDYFHQRASRLLQWCIAEKLHDAMEPQLV